MLTSSCSYWFHCYTNAQKTCGGLVDYRNPLLLCLCISSFKHICRSNTLWKTVKREARLLGLKPVPFGTPFSRAVSLLQSAYQFHSQLNVLCTCPWGVSCYLENLYVIKHKAVQVNWNCYFWNWKLLFFSLIVAIPQNKVVTVFGIHSSGSEDSAHRKNIGSQCRVLGTSPEDLDSLWHQWVLGIYICNIRDELWEHYWSVFILKFSTLFTDLSLVPDFIIRTW